MLRDGVVVESVSLVDQAPSFAHDDYREVVLWSRTVDNVDRASDEPVKSFVDEIAGLLRIAAHRTELGGTRWWHRRCRVENSVRPVRARLNSGDVLAVDTEAASPEAALRTAIEAFRRSGIDARQRVSLAVKLAGMRSRGMALRVDSTLGSSGIPEALLRLLAVFKWSSAASTTIEELTRSHPEATPGDLGVGLYVGYHAPPSIVHAVGRWFMGGVDDDVLAAEIAQALNGRVLVPSSFGRGELVPWEGDPT